MSLQLILGSSGAGKTTLCSLIPRFYDVSSGSICLDGTDVRKIKLQSLRNHIGIVQQDVYLFDGTIRDNISYGRPDASDEDIAAAMVNLCRCGTYNAIKTAVHDLAGNKEAAL